MTRTGDWQKVGEDKNQEALLHLRRAGSTQCCMRISLTPFGGRVSFVRTRTTYKQAGQPNFFLNHWMTTHF
jgi:hypothetical protein